MIHRNAPAAPKPFGKILIAGISTGLSSSQRARMTATIVRMTITAAALGKTISSPANIGTTKNRCMVCLSLLQQFIGWNGNQPK